MVKTPLPESSTGQNETVTVALEWPELTLGEVARTLLDDFGGYSTRRDEHDTIIPERGRN